MALLAAGGPRFPLLETYSNSSSSFSLSDSLSDLMYFERCWVLWRGFLSFLIEILISLGHI